MSKTDTTMKEENKMKSINTPAAPVKAPRITGSMTFTEIGERLDAGEVHEELNAYMARRAARGDSLKCDVYDWSESEHEADEADNPLHDGVLAYAASGESSVDLDRFKDNDHEWYSFEIPSWSIAPENAEKEIADLRSILDQFEAAIKAVK